VLVTTLIFQSPYLFLKQRPDSSWNVAHLIKSTPEQSSALLWRIALQNVQIRNGALALAPLDTSQKLLPRRIESLSTNLRLDYAEPRVNVILRNLQLTALNPPLQLDSLAAQVFWGGDSLQIKNLRLRSEHSRLTGQILLRHLARPIYDVNLSCAPLHLTDLHALFKKFPVTGPVQGSLHTFGDAQNVRTAFDLQHDDGRAAGNFWMFFDSTTTSYEVEATVRELNLTPYWRGAPGATQLNFAIKLAGSGLTPADLNAALSMQLDSSLVLGRSVSTLRLTAEAANQQIKTKLTANSPIGELELSGKLIDPRHEQRFELNAEARHLNVAKLFQNDTLDSDVSFHVAGSGQHFDAARRKFSGWLQMGASRVPSVLIDNAYCRFNVSGADLQLDTLHVASSVGNIHAGGYLSLNYTNNFRFRAELGDLAWIKSAVDADTLRARGVFSGSAIGPFDSLAVFSRFNLQKVKYNRTFIDRLAGTLTFRRTGNDGGGFILARGTKMMLGLVPADSMKASVYYDLTRAQLFANFWQGEKNTGEIEGDYTYGEIGRFDVARCEINLFGQVWRTPQNRAMWIDVGDDDYDFHDCVLASANQRFHLDGRLSYIGAEDLRFTFENIDVATLVAVARNGNAAASTSIGGSLNGQGHLTGTAEAPILSGELRWNNGRVADFAFEKWEANFGYAGEKFSWVFKLHQTQDRFLSGDGFLPMNLALNPASRDKILYRERPMRIQASTTDIDLAFLQTLTNRVQQVQGKLVFDIKMENTPAVPHPTGVLRILDGAFSVPEHDANYNDVQLTLSIDSAAVKLVEFRLHSDKGELGITGQVNRTQTAITNATARLTAKDFLVVRNRDMELRLDANITGDGDAEGPSYRGDITVERSRFFLPALQQRAVIQLNETEEKAIVADTLRRTVSIAAETPVQRWLQKLRGEVKIDIPRNTWLRGPELNAEISGALDFVQESLTKFSLFGTLNIIRGTYELYGKKFDIEKGQINFEGKPDLPKVELVAQHVFRSALGDREKKNLEVKISGELNNPKIEFLRDNQALDTKETLDGKDALANLLFGVDFNQLLPGQRKSLENEADAENDAFSAAARGLVSGLVSQELARSLGRSLNLDLIEFQSGEDITKSSVLVGKYLTDNLFLSFGHEPEGRVVSLEWELMKFLFLQAAHGGEENRKTGFDLIWKLDW
jgi:translocation and assembly module TamB